jgi:hypothetical protein
VNTQLMPDAMRMYLSVMKAFAAHRSLGGKVLFCQLRTDEKSILGPLELKYGSEAGHLGLIAQWVVKEDIAGELTLGM